MGTMPRASHQNTADLCVALRLSAIYFEPPSAANRSGESPLWLLDCLHSIGYSRNAEMSKCRNVEMSKCRETDCVWWLYNISVHTCSHTHTNLHTCLHTCVCGMSLHTVCGVIVQLRGGRSKKGRGAAGRARLVAHRASHGKGRASFSTGRERGREHCSSAGRSQRSLSAGGQSSGAAGRHG